MTNAVVQLRNLATGQLAGTTTTNVAGQFSFIHNQPQANLALIANAVTAVPDPPLSSRAFRLTARPNPAAGVTRIGYTLARAANVTLVIHDVAGREVMRLLNEAPREPGEHEARFDTRVLPNGLYLCRLRIGTESVTRKLVVAR